MSTSSLPRQLFSPQRSATQIFPDPSRAASTALVAPQVLPSGNFAQSSRVR